VDLQTKALWLRQATMIFKILIFLALFHDCPFTDVGISNESGLTLNIHSFFVPQLAMAQESSLFHGEWWRKLPMVSLPPDPQPLDSLKARSFELDLERAASLSLPFSHDNGTPESELLAQYPAQLETYSRNIALFGDKYSEHSEDGGPYLQIYHFRYLRHYDLQRISNRLYYLQTWLRQGYILSNKDEEELNRLLKDQGIFSVLDKY
jgi:hypothetical protein